MREIVVCFDTGYLTDDLNPMEYSDLTDDLMEGLVQ